MNYNVLFFERSGERSAAQITAFEDTWQWGRESAQAYHRIVQDGPPKLAKLLDAFHQFLSTNDMMAYLTMMAIRLTELHRVLKHTGCIYLHCDPTASHYLKVTIQVVKTGITPQLATSARLREAKKELLHPVRRLHTP